MDDDALSTYSCRATSQLDVDMMAQYPGGKERTKKEFEALAHEAGFSNVDLVCCVYNFWVMEFYN